MALKTISEAKKDSKKAAKRRRPMPMEGTSSIVSYGNGGRIQKKKK